MDHPSLKICAALVLGAVLLAAPLMPFLRSLSTIAPPSSSRSRTSRTKRCGAICGLTSLRPMHGKEQEVPKHEVKPEQPKEEGKASGEIEEKEMKEDGLDVPE